MSYMVMECHPTYAILLDEEGRFLKAANLHYEVGQTVYSAVPMRESAPKQRHITRWVSSGVAAVAACFVLIFGIGYYQNYMATYSSILLSINPEVQMDLSRQGTVVSLTGTNEDGEKLLVGYDGKGKNKVTVADELIDRAIEMGYLTEGGQVSFSIDTPDDALFQEYGVELRSKVTEHLDGRITVTIRILDHRNGNKEDKPESSSTPASSKPTETSSASSEPSQPVVASPVNLEDDDDTDYGPNNDGVTDYTSGDTDYSPNSDGVTDYNDTDYGPNNDGVTDYTSGETLPDISTLPDLANVLETTIDNILFGGEHHIVFKGKIKVQDMIEGIKCLKRMGELLGNHNIIYRCAIQGIDSGMNTEVEPAFSDDYYFEAFVAEAIIQNLKAGLYVDITDIKRNFKHEHFRTVVLEYAKKYNIA